MSLPVAESPIKTPKSRTAYIIIGVIVSIAIIYGIYHWYNSRSKLTNLNTFTHLSTNNEPNSSTNLMVNQKITSPSGTAELKLVNGNLSVIVNGKVVANTNTPFGEQAIIMKNGSFLVTGDHKILYASPYIGSNEDDYTLKITDNGNLIMQNSSGKSRIINLDV